MENRQSSQPSASASPSSPPPPLMPLSSTLRRARPRAPPPPPPPRISSSTEAKLKHEISNVDDRDDNRPRRPLPTEWAEVEVKVGRGTPKIIIQTEKQEASGGESGNGTLPPLPDVIMGPPPGWQDDEPAVSNRRPIVPQPGTRPRSRLPRNGSFPDDQAPMWRPSPVTVKRPKSAESVELDQQRLLLESHQWQIQQERLREELQRELRHRRSKSLSSAAAGDDSNNSRVRRTPSLEDNAKEHHPRRSSRHAGNPRPSTNLPLPWETLVTAISPQQPVQKQRSRAGREPHPPAPIDQAETAAATSQYVQEIISQQKPASPKCVPKPHHYSAKEAAAAAPTAAAHHRHPQVPFVEMAVARLKEKSLPSQKQYIQQAAVSESSSSKRISSNPTQISHDSRHFTERHESQRSAQQSRKQIASGGGKLPADANSESFYIRQQQLERDRLHLLERIGAVDEDEAVATSRHRERKSRRDLSRGGGHVSKVTSSSPGVKRRHRDGRETAAAAAAVASTSRSRDRKQGRISSKEKEAKEKNLSSRHEMAMASSEQRQALPPPQQQSRRKQKQSAAAADKSQYRRKTEEGEEEKPAKRRLKESEAVGERHSRARKDSESSRQRKKSSSTPYSNYTTATERERREIQEFEEDRKRKRAAHERKVDDDIDLPEQPQPQPPSKGDKGSMLRTVESSQTLDERVKSKEETKEPLEDEARRRQQQKREQRKKEAKEKLAREMAEKEKVAREMADRERKAQEVAEKDRLAREISERERQQMIEVQRRQEIQKKLEEKLEHEIYVLQQQKLMLEKEEARRRRRESSADRTLLSGRQQPYRRDRSKARSEVAVQHDAEVAKAMEKILLWSTDLASAKTLPVRYRRDYEEVEGPRPATAAAAAAAAAAASRERPLSSPPCTCQTPSPSASDDHQEDTVLEAHTRRYSRSRRRSGSLDAVEASYESRHKAHSGYASLPSYRMRVETEVHRDAKRPQTSSGKHHHQPHRRHNHPPPPPRHWEEGSQSQHSTIPRESSVTSCRHKQRRLSSRSFTPDSEYQRMCRCAPDGDYQEDDIYGDYAEFKPPVGHRRNGSAPSFGADGLDGSAHSVASTRPMLYTDAPVFYPDANGRTPGEDLPENGTLQNGFSALRQLSSAAVDVASNLPRLAANKVNFAVMRGLKFRRQHWCLLFVLVFGASFGFYMLLSSGDVSPFSNLSDVINNPQLQLATVAKLLREVPLVDGHNDLPWNIRKFVHNKLDSVNFTHNLNLVDPWSKSKWSHTDIARLKAGMVGCQLWVAYAPCGSQHKDAVQVTLEQIDLIKRFVESYPNHLRLVNNSQDLIAAHAEGKIASIVTVESGHSIGTSLGVLRMFHKLGARSLTLTHNCNTPWADCSIADLPDEKPEHGGLTQFGRTVIAEMNRLGMIIDLSHSSIQTAEDALTNSAAPVIFSHSSAKAICNSTRNIPDKLLRLVADKKGLVMVNFFSYFITCDNHSTLNDVIAHLNHIKRVAGVDYVGIGASYDGINSTPSGLEDVSKYPALFAGLLASGSWSLEDLKKLAGQNFLRVFREVERVSRDYYETRPEDDTIPIRDLKGNTDCKTQSR